MGLELELDEDGYPTRESLDQIRAFPITMRPDCRDLLLAVRCIWAYADNGYWQQDGDIFQLSTAGWSGNEDIIQALEENRMFWLLSRELIKRGGHYQFNVPGFPQEEAIGCRSDGEKLGG